MEIRPIDANALQELCNRGIQNMWNTGVAPVSWAEAYADFKNDIDSMPTLTPPNEWVRVEDRLPEPTYCVLVYTTDYSIEVDALDSDGEWMSFEVTHWMLLPAPPDRRPPEGDCEIKDYAETCEECGFCDNTLVSPPEGEEEDTK